MEGKSSKETQTRNRTHNTKPKASNLFLRMKKVILASFILLLTLQTHAQVAGWTIPPQYDSIYFADGADLIITDSLNEKSVWTRQGKRLFKTSDILHPFADGIAVTTDPESDMITGFYTINGGFTSLSGYSIAHDYPYFSDGYLLVKKQDKYYFADPKGKVNEHGVVLAYPFHGGFASCKDYKNPDKPKDLCNFLINKDKKKTTFTFKDKPFNIDDLEFISSVNDEGIGIVVAKRKVYFFENGIEELRPVFINPEVVDMKQQAKLSGKVADCLTATANSNYILYANCGKIDQISFQFDERMVPVAIRYNVESRPFNQSKESRVLPDSPIGTTRSNNLLGLSVDGDDFLPAQFDAIYKSFGNEAFVKASGKQGLIWVSTDDSFKLSINKGKDIAFRHQTYETPIRLDMPKSVPSEKTELRIASPDSGCQIDQTSKEAKDTPNGNYIQYQSTLYIPNDLPDEITEISYPIQIVSDGIKFPVVKLNAKAWHYKYLTIDIINSETTISKGTVSFTFDINAERFSDEDFYPTSINIVTDSLLYSETQKISESRYKCQVFDLKEGYNDITIEIIEQGCPPISSPWRINYNKPSAKTKHKETVEIKKKTKEDEIEEEEDLHFDY